MLSALRGEIFKVTEHGTTGRKQFFFSRVPGDRKETPPPLLNPRMQIEVLLFSYYQILGFLYFLPWELILLSIFTYFHRAGERDLDWFQSSS
jgi:hypothetical protein